MNRSSRLKNIINKRQDLWNEPETDTSSISDNDNIKISTRKKSLNTSDTSSDENTEPFKRKTCCLICSVLPNLTNVNTCPKHLASLSTPITPTQVVYMMHPAMNNCPKLHCHCRSKSKHRCRSSSSSSSSSSKGRHYRKKRTMTVESSDSSSQDDVFFSPDIQSGEATTTISNNQQHRSNHAQLRLSPSLPPSSTINTNLQKYNQLLFASFLQRTEQQNNDEIESMLKNTQNRSLSQENSPDVIVIDSDSSCSSPISDNRIIHVKDDGESLNDIDRKNLSINMAQVTEQMQNHEYPQPVILLKRVCLEKYKPLFE